MSFEDTAQDIELKQWELNNLGRMEIPSYSPGEAGYGPAKCKECNSEMPDVRRAMGETLCVSCKQITELQRRR